MTKREGPVSLVSDVPTVTPSERKAPPNYLGDDEHPIS